MLMTQVRRRPFWCEVCFRVGSIQVHCINQLAVSLETHQCFRDFFLKNEIQVTSVVGAYFSIRVYSLVECFKGLFMIVDHDATNATRSSLVRNDGAMC